MSRDAGTYEVLLVVHAGTEEGAEHLMSRFARRSIALGTVVIVSKECREATRHDWVVTIVYRHTCRNKGNVNSDARRFIGYAAAQKNGKTYRYDWKIERVRPWKELVQA